MRHANVSIRMDEALKRDFGVLCGKLGFSMTAAFNIFASNAVHLERIPFELHSDTPNAETIAAIKEVQRMKKNPNKKLYASFSELLKEVEADV